MFPEGLMKWISWTAADECPASAGVVSAATNAKTTMKRRRMPHDYRAASEPRLSAQNRHRHVGFLARHSLHGNETPCTLRTHLRSDVLRPGDRNESLRRHGSNALHLSERLRRERVHGGRGLPNLQPRVSRGHAWRQR